MKKKFKFFVLVFIMIINITSFNNFIYAVENTNENNDSAKEKTSSSNSLIVETSNINKIEKNDNVENVLEIAENTYIVDYKSETIANEELNNLKNDSSVNAVLPDIKVSIVEDETTSIQSYNKNYLSWGYESTGMDHYIDYLSYKSKSNIKVAVLDTGINSNHEAFKSTTTADRIDTAYAYNYISESKNIADDNGHGTKVASVITSSTPSNVKIVPIKVLNSSGEGNLSDSIRAIREIKDNVDIINMSLGVKNSEINAADFQQLENIFKGFYNNGNGPLIVCASGNEASNEVIYPANSQYTIAVSALRKTTSGEIQFASSFSNYGSSIDFAAPGEKIYAAKYSTNNEYALSTGTSIATPFVSAAAALIKSDYSSYNIIQIKQKLIENAEDLGSSGKDQYYGYGSISFKTKMFEKPYIFNIIKSNATSTSCKVTANAICDDNITKYAYIVSGREISNSNWISISSPKNNVQISFTVYENKSYDLYFMDSEGQISKKQFTVSEITTIKNATVSYRTHVQNVGWQSYVSNGAMSGTSGRSLRLEGINIKLVNQPYSGNIEYCTHIQNIGWQNYKKNNELSGTQGQSLRLEAIKIRLTGEMANKFDVYYRVHAQEIGWMNWAKNGEAAGTSGFSYRLEGIEIVLVEKGKNPPSRSNTAYSKAFKNPMLSYRTHVQDIGWQGYVYDGVISGTSGQSKRLEGININLQNQPYTGNIEYCTHVQNIGWQNYVKNGAMSGTSGQSLRLEAIKIRLTGEMANKYDIYYRTHCQQFGWLGWAKNGQESGSAGYSYRLEAIQIVLVEKGGSAPGSTSRAFVKK